MSHLTPNSKLTLALGSAAAVAGSLILAGWTAASLLGDIRTELAAIRFELRSGWSSRDMHDFSTDLERLNTSVSRTDGKVGLIVPDARRIQRTNREN